MKLYLPHKKLTLISPEKKETIALTSVVKKLKYGNLTIYKYIKWTPKKGEVKVPESQFGNNNNNGRVNYKK